MDTYIVKLDGQEIARVQGDGITYGQKVVQHKDKWVEEVVPDQKLLKIIRDGKTIVVWYVTSAVNVTVEKHQGELYYFCPDMMPEDLLAWAREHGFVRKSGE